MRPKIAIIYNEPAPDRYNVIGEERAVLGVLDEVGGVNQALSGLGYPVACLPLSPPLEKARESLKNLKADLVFNLFEGFAGSPETEAQIAAILQELKLPFTGCSGATLALALEKPDTKALLEANGIETPGYQLLNPGNLSSFRLGFPCIVKPAGEDASHGLSENSVVHDLPSLEKQVVVISQRYGGKAIVEEYIEGREFNATVLGDREPQVLPVTEIVFSLPEGKPRILTFAAKWEPGSIYYNSSQAVCPAGIESGLQAHIIATAGRVFVLVGGSGYARVDFRLDASGRLCVIEINPNPDISPDAGAARQARAAGMTYPQFIENLVRLALD